MVREIFAHESDRFKLIAIFIIVFILAAAVSVLSIFIAMPVFGITFSDIQQILSSGDYAEHIDVLKFIQLFQSVGLFIIPAFLYYLLFTHKQNDELQLHSTPNSYFIVLVFITLMVSSPLINFLMKVNSMLSLPEFMSGIENWMIRSEESAEKLTNAFLMNTSIPNLLFNILMIAIIPALGEELIFRGILQKLFTNIFKNAHWGILISAFIFSAFHMQFFGFLPRFVLGAYFGYLLYWTKNLWYPIIGHFINNGFAVLYAYYATKNDIDWGLDTIGYDKSTFIYVPMSLTLVIGVIYFSWRESTRNV